MKSDAYISDEYIDRLLKEHPDWHLFTEYRGEKPWSYRFGEEWVATQLMIEGGFKTKTEAVMDWLKHLDEKGELA